MPTTRSRKSQREVETNNLSLSSDDECSNEIQDHPVDECSNPDCGKKYEFTLPFEKFDLKHKCPCIFTVCKDCENESEELKEYCPLDKHDNPEDFIKNLKPVTDSGKEKNLQELEEETLNKYNLNGKQIFIYIENDSDHETHRNLEREDTNLNVLVIKLSAPKIKPDEHSLVLNKFTVFALIVALVALYLYMAPSSKFPIDNKVIKTNEEMIKEVLEILTSLESRYEKQPKDLWAALKLGMRNLLTQSAAPTTILLLHSENTTMDTCFLCDIKKVANDIAMYQLNTGNKNSSEISSTQPKPCGIIIDMEHETDVFDNPGVFMEKYKAQAKTEKLMIVLNFHKSPLPVMEAFHFISDTYSPWVENLLIILTLEVKEINHQNHEYIAENELRKILKNLPGHKSDPLITRLTENVYLVAEESKSTLACSLSCPLQ
ncbi:hypothetical protein M8J76_015937 [Diaphorina citri]|nr:hypothetical protein M8J75_005399 [Diaphorina citri]KAI5733789.1 hypothetical protein M8J76_015937 [Diaphorina citri]